MCNCTPSSESQIICFTVLLNSWKSELFERLINNHLIVELKQSNYTVKPRFTVPWYTWSFDLPGLNFFPTKPTLYVNRSKLYLDLPCPSICLILIFLTSTGSVRSGFYSTLITRHKKYQSMVATMLFLITESVFIHEISSNCCNIRQLPIIMHREERP